MPAPTSGEGRLAIIVKGWPRLSESFIAQEVLALERLGFKIDLYSLRHPTDTAISAFQKDITASVAYLPEYLHQEPLRVFQGWRYARRLPGFARARTVFCKDFRRDPTRNRIRRFGQAMVLASEIAPHTNRLHAQFLHTPCSVTRYAALMLQRPFSFSAHAKDIWTTPDWEKREKIADANFGVTCTELGLQDLTQHAHPDDRHKLHLMYHGIDPDRFPRAPAVAATSEGPLKLLSVGRAVEKKGFEILLEGFSKLPPDLDWTWTHCGGGAGLQSLMALAERYGLGKRVTWRGPIAQEHLVAIYKAHDVFVMPSRQTDNQDQDGLPNVLMEAQSQGMACIATHVGGIPELILPNETGILVPPNHPEALARAIIDIAADPKKRQRFGQAAQERIHAHFLLPDHIGKLDKLLREEGA